MKKIYWTRLILFFAMLTGFGFLFNFAPKHERTFSSDYWRYFYKDLPKNSMDVVFLGNSHSQCTFIPEIIDFSVIDRIESCTTELALETSRRLAKEAGLLSGISCGAAAAVALRLAALDEFAGKTIVAILPDSGERYLSTKLFNE